MQGARVQSLVGELRSHMLRGAAKKIKRRDIATLQNSGHFSLVALSLLPSSALGVLIYKPLAETRVLFCLRTGVGLQEMEGAPWRSGSPVHDPGASRGRHAQPLEIVFLQMLPL